MFTNGCFDLLHAGHVTYLTEARALGAVARLSVADLPATVTLDGSTAMVPTMTIGAFPSVTVGARVSASGEPVAASGDWFDEAEGVDASARPTLELTLDRQVP